jgi:hypothetical protein
MRRETIPEMAVRNRPPAPILVFHSPKPSRKTVLQGSASSDHSTSPDMGLYSSRSVIRTCSGCSSTSISGQGTRGFAIPRCLAIYYCIKSASFQARCDCCRDYTSLRHLFAFFGSMSEIGIFRQSPAHIQQFGLFRLPLFKCIPEESPRHEEQPHPRTPA